MSDSRVADLENSNADYRRRLAEANDRIRLLEEQLAVRNISGAEKPAGADL